MTTRCRTGWLVSFLVVVAGFAGCNLFNPSGSGDRDGGDVDGLIELGQEHMRAREFAAAYDAFSQALARDSSKSLAWHGLSKALIGRDSLPVTELIRRAQDLGNLQPGDSMPFLKDNDSIKNRFYRPLLRLQSLLMAFHRRDSLGRTDGVYASSRSSMDLLIASNLGLVLKLGDLNRDTLFSQRDNLLRGAFDSLSSGGIKPSVIAPDSFLSKPGDTTGKVDPQKVADFNTFLQGMGDDVEVNRTILKQAAAADPGASADSQSMDAKIDKFLSAAGNSIVFWKLNDSLDNDGDGCVDEEVWGDSLDNDGDGIVDEDARIAYVLPGVPRYPGLVFANAPDDGIRNDRLDPITGRYVVGVDDVVTGMFVRSTASVAMASAGRNRAFQDLLWVDPKTDTAWANTLRDFPTETEEEQVSRTRNRIRLRILALPIAQRVAKGAMHVGGCWSAMQGGAR